MCPGISSALALVSLPLVELRVVCSGVSPAPTHSPLVLVCGGMA